MKPKSLRTRVAAGVLAAATGVLGLVAAQGSTGAAITPVVYTCKGVTGDIAGKRQTGWDIFQNKPIYSNMSTAGLLSWLGSTLQPLGVPFTQTPAVTATFDATLPNPMAVGTSYGTMVNASVSLPADLVSAATTYLKISSVQVKNTSVNVAATNATPATLTATLPDQVISLTPGTSVNTSVTANLTANAAGGVTLTPGGAEWDTTPGATQGPAGAHVELKFGDPSNNNGIRITSISIPGGPTIPADIYLYQVGFNCWANTLPAISSALATGGTGGSSTTETPTTETPTTQTPTTETPTTETPTTETPTTQTPTTQTPTTETPTTQTPTTLVPGDDAVTVSVSGFGYSNSGAVGGPGYTISSDQFGVSRVSGTGILPGTNGGNATVSVDITRGLFWGFGQIRVNDPSAGINVTGYAFFAPAPSKSGTSSTVTGSGILFVPNRGFVNYTVTATVSDNG